jgi:hypothetical protein
MFNRMIGVVVAGSVAAACSVAPSDGTGEVTEDSMPVMNGLPDVNGLGVGNGLMGQNGLFSENGFNSENGQSVVNGLPCPNGLLQVDGSGNPTVIPNGGDEMNSANGRSLVMYIARCALTPTQSITRKDSLGNVYTYPGEDGVAPEWYSTATGACGEACQEKMTACLLAHLNVSGQHCKICMTSDIPSIGNTRTATQTGYYSLMTGAYFGNIFTPKAPTAYVCEGGGAPANFSTDRCYGASGSSTCPFVNQIGVAFPCTTICQADAGGLNMSACTIPSGTPGTGKTWNNVITVWEPYGGSCTN